MSLEAELLEYECQQEEALEEAELLRLREICDISFDLSSCSALRDRIATLNENCQSKKVELLKLQFLFESRQLKLLSEVKAIYPIACIEGSSEYSIRGVELHLDSRCVRIINLQFIVCVKLFVNVFIAMTSRFLLHWDMSFIYFF